MNLKVLYSVTILLGLLLMSFNSYSLEVDEKLTVRLLKLSNSKKTILINRGIEDGLAKDNHAKFFLTSGVIARGFIVKISPSRSVWSMYRISRPDELKENIVMNIKIATPVKLTPDASRALKSGDEHGSIVIAPGANDTPENLTDEEKKELSTLGGDEGDSEGDLLLSHSLRKMRKKWELWSNLSVSMLSSSYAQGSTSSSGSNNSIDIGLGAERYFDLKNFIRNFSLAFFLEKYTSEVINISGISSKSDALIYGGMLNWYFWNDPFLYNSIIPFINVKFGFGSSDDSVTSDSSSVTSVSNSGTVSSVGLGLGMKYFLSNGFGLRSALDYFSRTETYSDTSSTAGSYTKKLSGPRLSFGLLYRW